MMEEKRDLGLGHTNEHAIGIILKDLIWRAMTEIRAQQISFEVQAKRGYDGEMDDVKTSADTSAQRIVIKSLQECFPNAGILGEEGDGKPVAINPKNSCTVIFTVDPLDGTKAFVRRQSHGVGSMIALVDRGTVLSAWIGDVNTGEMYGFRPFTSNVHRIPDMGPAQRLTAQAKPVKDSYILLRDPPERYDDHSRAVLGRFKSYQVDGGSIGIWFARLWKHEVAALLLPTGYETPWDSAPVIGISRKLGYAFLRRGEQPGMWTEYEPRIALEPYERTHEVLVIHQNMANQILLK